MVKKGGAILLKGLLVFLTILALGFVIASNVLPTSQSVVEDVSTLYNVTVINNGAELGANITGVNVTIPSGFVFVSGTNNSGPSVSSVFSNTTTVLSWSNVTAYLVANGSSISLYFNLTASTPGTAYNLTVRVSNESRDSAYLNNVSVNVSDVTAPSLVVFSNGTETTQTNTSRRALAYNVSFADNGVLGTLAVRVYFSNGSVVNTTYTSAASLTSILGNITVREDGVYYMNASVNDSAGYTNYTTSTIIVRSDSWAPTIFDSDGELIGDYTYYIFGIVDDSFGGLLVSDVATAVSYVGLNITNSTNGTLIRPVINLTFDGTYWTGEFNSTAYPDGLYNVSVSANDTLNNWNYSQKSHIYIDNSDPVIALQLPENGISTTTDDFYFTYNVTESVWLDSCTLYIDGITAQSNTSLVNRTGGANTMYNDSLLVGAHSWYVNCTDFAGNVANSSTFTLTITNSSTTTTTSSSSGRSGGSAASTFSPGVNDLSGGYKVSLRKSSKVNFKVGTESHIILVDNVVSGASVEVTVSSTPQKATIASGETKKFDVNADGTYDISVYVSSVATGASPTASLVITTISEKVTSAPAAETPSTPPASDAPAQPPANAPAQPEGKSNGVMIFVIILVLVVVIGIAIYLMKFRKR